MTLENAEIHPIANAFPMMSEQEIAELAEDIKARGLRHPIVLYEGKILDGRNRVQAAKRADVPITHETYDGDDPVGFVISLNLKRRHLDQSQRAMVASKLAELPRGRPSGKASIDALTDAEAAALLNVSEPSVERAKVVRRKGTPELVTAVEKGDIAVSTAADLATLPEAEQRKAVEGGKKAAAAVAKEVREAKKRAPSAMTPPPAEIDPAPPPPYTPEHLHSLWNPFRDAHAAASPDVRAEFERTKQPLADDPATPVPVEAAAAATPDHDVEARVVGHEDLHGAEAGPALSETAIARIAEIDAEIKERVALVPYAKMTRDQKDRITALQVERNNLMRSEVTAD